MNGAHNPSPKPTKGQTDVSNEEPTRKENDEEVIEVITQDGDEAEWEEADRSARTARDVEIIGDRSTRRGGSSSPGCLYSFLVLAIGVLVGWFGCYTFDLETTDPGEEAALVNVNAMNDASGQLRGEAKTEIEEAYKLASERNYGDALRVLKRAARWFAIAGKITPAGSGAREDREGVEAAIALLESDDPADQVEAVHALAKLAGVTEEPASTESATESGEPAAESAATEPTSEAKPEAKPEEKTEEKTEAKTDATADAKPEAKPEPKPEAKPAAKPSVKSETATTPNKPAGA